MLAQGILPLRKPRGVAEAGPMLSAEVSDVDEGRFAAKHGEDGELQQASQGYCRPRAARGSGNSAGYSTSERSILGLPRNRGT